jgi:hypothetical protein
MQGPGGPNPYMPPQAGAPGFAPNQGGAQPGGEYEFSDQENHQINDLASKMRFVGLMGIIFGVILVLGGLAACAGGSKTAGNGIGNFLQGIFAILVGVWTRSAAAAFQRIVDTQGNDVFNLMGALGELRRIYGLQRVLLIILIVLMVVLVPLVFLLFMSRAPSHM